uniref:Cyclic nucleotide-binding domain-containing protein n=1 Tax=Macrostomum lignano TaxID=282301 RepID=A0A1I8JDS9_9PLAT
MKWLRELSNRDARQGKVTVLGEIQDEVLHEIVKSSKVEAYKPNQILIKQGNVGFTMYIILTGMCDIRISSADTTEEDDAEATEDPFEEGDVLVKKKPAEIEALLGVSVGTFKAGHAFGEVALVSGVLRTASVIVNPDSDICQVLVIDKSLFDRTLQDYMRREEAGKANFIEQFSHFSTWPVKFRQQLLRGLSKTRFKYSEQVMRQGDEIDCVYFITSGEVKQSLVPGLHPGAVQPVSGAPTNRTDIRH